MKNILLIRHGQSEWNKLNLFTGFKNIELSEQGIEEANKAGQNFKNLDIKFNIVFTSELKRAQETAKIILQNLDQLHRSHNGHGETTVVELGLPPAVAVQQCA